MKTHAIELKVQKITQPIGEFFIASIPAQQLVEITHSDVRRVESEDREVERYLGIQRPLSKKRVREIRKYVDSPDATFPTSIILAVDEKCAEYDEKKGLLFLKEYRDGDVHIPTNKIAKILDGQHRIAAFLTEDEEYPLFGSQFELNVSIFIGIDIDEQANIFATVNLAQTKVNKNLVYDLTELAKSRSPYKTCHNIAVALDSMEESPLYRRIKRLGVATPGRKYEPLTQAAFVESLIPFISKDPMSDRNLLLKGRNLSKALLPDLLEQPFRNIFVEEQDTVIAKIIINYFKAIEARWPKSWKDTHVKGNILPKSNAFKAFMKFLLDPVYVEIVGQGNIGAVPSVEDFLSRLKRVKVTDRDFTSRNFLPGSSGMAAIFKLLKGELTIDEISS